jgi:hypothetical protein
MSMIRCSREPKRTDLSSGQLNLRSDLLSLRRRRKFGLLDAKGDTAIKKINERLRTDFSRNSSSSTPVRATSEAERRTCSQRAFNSFNCSGFMQVLKTRNRAERFSFDSECVRTEGDEDSPSPVDAARTHVYQTDKQVSQLRGRRPGLVGQERMTDMEEGGGRKGEDKYLGWPSARYLMG